MPLLILASTLLFLAGILAFVSLSYQPELAPLTNSEPKALSVATKSVAGAGILLLGLSAMGFGGLVLAGILVVAFATSRS